jgi:DnaJ-class molecular chaperone
MKFKRSSKAKYDQYGHQAFDGSGGLAVVVKVV